MSDITGKKDDSFKAIHDEKEGMKADEKKKAKKAAEEKAAPATPAAPEKK